MKKILSFSEFVQLTEAFDFKPEGYQDRIPSKQPIKAILASPKMNVMHKWAKQHNENFELNQKPPESNLMKQYVIGKTFELAATGSPDYKKAVFDSYKNHSSSLVGKSKDYDDFVKQSYTSLSKDVDRQFDTLPMKLHYHDGEDEYSSSAEMVKDVHHNNNLNVFRGGEAHTFSKTDRRSGLTTNEKFRAVHDASHAINGSQFGPKGEEEAWFTHSQLFSNKALPAMTAETRGQNSMVNYTPLNLTNMKAMAIHRAEAARANKLGDSVKENYHKDQVRQIGRNWNYAPQRAVVLPHEMNQADFTGDVPKSIKHLLRDPRAEQNSQYDSKADHLGIVALSRHYHPDEWHDVATKLARVHGFRSVSKDVLKEDTSLQLRTVSPEEFHAAIQPSLNTDRGEANLTNHPIEHYHKAKRLVLSHDNESGYAVFGDNEFGNLFSRVKGRGSDLVKHAVQTNPGVHGNAFDGYLVNLYKKHGAVETKREANWTPGGPDVVHIKFPK